MKNGFTLIELLVVVAITSVVMVTGFVYLGSYRAEQNLKLTSSELLSAVKNTQSLSKSQQNGKRWGVHFVNTTSSAGQSYSVFSGTAYATSGVSQTYPLRRNVSFSNPWASSTIDTIFNAVTGYPSQPQAISMVDGRQDGFVNDIIMNSLGQITSKFDTGLVGYWHFDEGVASTTYDASGRGNSGTLTNGPTWQAGVNCKAGNCLSFNGSSNYVDAGSGTSLNLPNNITISAWIKSNNISSIQTIVGKTGANTASTTFWMDIRNSGTQVIFGGYTPAGGTAYTTQSYNFLNNVWYNIVGVDDGSLLNIYVNGNSIGSGPRATRIEGNWSVHIGERAGGNYFNGLIDEVRIYNRALSATEISDIYNSTR